MSADIQKRTLLVVSDTAMFHDGQDLLVFNPVLRELNVISDMFDEIIWLGARSLTNKRSMTTIDNDKIKAEMLPCVSRSGWVNVLYVLFAYPVILLRILKYLRQATHVHTRAPSHPAWVMIVLSLLDNKRVYAHKYAGEWTDRNIPFTYRVQRSLLKRVRKPNIKVVISGKNEEESANVHDMENPCMYENELTAMNEATEEKIFSQSLKLLFVGNLIPTKGILELLQALSSNELSSKIESLTIAGGGRLHNEVVKQAENVNRVKVKVLGYMSRTELNKQYKDAHVLILPSSSESFPKVVAEASAFGCIPVTTSLSAITKKVKDGKNGFLMDSNSPENILKTLNRVAACTDLKHVSTEAVKMSRLFTYKRFKSRMAQIYEIDAPV